MFTFDPKQLDDLVGRLTALVPPSLQHLREDLEKNFRSVLQGSFSKLDLVTREEFDVQTQVLARTRQRLETLEQQVTALETHTPQKKSS